MEHSTWSERNLAHGFRSADGKRLEEVLWRAHAQTLGGVGACGETAEPIG